MKIVQIGILAALIVCGALLFMVWKGQQNQPVAVTAPGTTGQMSPPAAEIPAPVEPAAQQPVQTAFRKGGNRRHRQNRSLKKKARRPLP